MYLKNKCRYTEPLGSEASLYACRRGYVLDDMSFTWGTYSSLHVARPSAALQRRVHISIRFEASEKQTYLAVAFPSLDMITPP